MPVCPSCQRATIPVARKLALGAGFEYQCTACRALVIVPANSSQFYLSLVPTGAMAGVVASVFAISGVKFHSIWAMPGVLLGGLVLGTALVLLLFLRNAPLVVKGRA